MPFIGRVKNLHCTGYSLLFPIRRYAGLKRTSIAVDRLPAVNLLADNCRQSPIRRDEGASDYLNIQQPLLKDLLATFVKKRSQPAQPGFQRVHLLWGDGLSAPPGYVRPAGHGASPQGPDKWVLFITANLLQRLAS